VYKRAIENEFDEMANLLNAFIERIRYLVIKVRNRGNCVATEVADMLEASQQMASAAVEGESQAKEVN
jgi:methyl-accepting chemotaxis protein